MKTQQSLVTLSIATPDGEFAANYSGKGLSGLSFPSAAKKSKAKSAGSSPSPEIRRWHRATTKALKAVLSGRAPGKLPPLDLSSGTDFQRAVWGALCKIAAGKPKSYGEVAAAIGKPKAVRAVGGACGANPIPVLIPCHRVLAANRKLGGFSGGLDWKRTLLAREGVNLS